MILDWRFRASSKAKASRTCMVDHVDLLSTIKNIDPGDHISQCDKIPGPVSSARELVTNKHRGKWADRVKNDVRTPFPSHTSFRGHFFNGVWKEGMETFGEDGVKVWICGLVGWGCSALCLYRSLLFRAWTVHEPQCWCPFFRDDNWLVIIDCIEFS